MKKCRAKQGSDHIKSKLMLVAITLFAAWAFWNLNQPLIQLMLSGEAEHITTLLDENITYAYLFMFMMMVVQNSFTIIPLLLVISINIGLFGFWNGFLWSWVTSILAAILIYICVKFLFQSTLSKKFNPELMEKVEREGFAYVFRGRIFPFVPTSLVNILAGLSTITFKHFLLGTIYGNFLYFFILSLIPAGLFSLKADAYVAGIFFVILFTLFYVFKKVYNKIRKDKNLPVTEKRKFNVRKLKSK